MTDDLRVDDDDWFGDGSSFDSGEELAAALAALGGVQPGGEGAASGVGASGSGPAAGVPEEPAAARNPRGGSVTAGQGADASQWPTISAKPPPARPPGGQAANPGWRIRQGVRSLRQAEEALERLRGDAIVVAWAAAAAALRRAGR